MGAQLRRIKSPLTAPPSSDPAIREHWDGENGQPECNFSAPLLFGGRCCALGLRLNGALFVRFRTGAPSEELRRRAEQVCARACLCVRASVRVCVPMARPPNRPLTEYRSIIALVDTPFAHEDVVQCFIHSINVPWQYITNVQ